MLRDREDANISSSRRTDYPILSARYLVSEFLTRNLKTNRSLQAIPSPVCCSENSSAYFLRQLRQPSLMTGLRAFSQMFCKAMSESDILTYAIPFVRPSVSKNVFNESQMFRVFEKCEMQKNSKRHLVVGPFVIVHFE